jgi:hypothetical protein
MPLLQHSDPKNGNNPRLLTRGPLWDQRSSTDDCADPVNNDFVSYRVDNIRNMCIIDPEWADSNRILSAPQLHRYRVVQKTRPWDPQCLLYRPDRGMLFLAGMIRPSPRP